jgi:hypothetical protein
MIMVAKELSENEELGLDEQTLLRIFDTKTNKLL